MRLRALGMPIPQIVSSLREGADATSLPLQLRTLADELDQEIVRLTATRDRLRELATTQTLHRPGETMTQALREHGLFGPQDVLPEGEQPAAALLDALHPQGVPGVLERAGGLLADPAARCVLAQLLHRFRALTDTSSAATIDSLAAEVAGVLPRPQYASQPVDPAVMEKLLGDRLNAGQLRFMRQLRGLLDQR